MNKQISLREFLQGAEDVIAADGAMATSLYDRGFYFNRSFEEISLTNPEAVKEVTAGFKRSGAQLLTTNTFGATLPKLMEYGIQDQQADILRAGVRLAKEVANGDAYVLGAMGPLGSLEPLGPTSVAEATYLFADVAKTLDEAGTDGFTLWAFMICASLKRRSAEFVGTRPNPSFRISEFKITKRPITGTPLRSMWHWRTNST